MPTRRRWPRTVKHLPAAAPAPPRDQGGDQGASGANWPPGSAEAIGLSAPVAARALTPKTQSSPRSPSKRVLVAGAPPEKGYGMMAYLAREGAPVIELVDTGLRGMMADWWDSPA